jgi:hypothetical protein
MGATIVEEARPVVKELVGVHSTDLLSAQLPESV